MQRTIKFRGKTKDNTWLYGNLQVPKPPFDDFFMWDENLYQRKVVPDTIGQYTGLKDKHGTEIYEGDILESEVHKAHYVGFCDGGFELIEPNEERLGLGRLSIYAKHMQVIGNIHDKPELIIDNKENGS